MTRTRTLRRVLIAAGASLLLVACAQADLVRGLIQLQLDRIWNDPARKAETEATAEAKAKAALDANLVGKSFEVTGPNPYVHHIKRLNIDLGDRGPVIAVPTATAWATSTHNYIEFPFEADWSKGNGAKMDLGLDLRTHSFWTAYEYPDHDVRVRDISAFAKGKALVVLPKAGGQGTATITVERTNVDLRAEAEGWFWTVNVSSDIKKEVDKGLVRDVIGKAIKLAFDAKL
jgi:hypothetical protein